MQAFISASDFRPMSSDARWNWVDVPVGTGTVRGITPVGRAETFYVRSDVPEEATSTWARFHVRRPAGGAVTLQRWHVLPGGGVDVGNPVVDDDIISAHTSPGSATYLTCVLDPGDVLIGVRLTYGPGPGEFVPVAPRRIFDKADILPGSEYFVPVPVPVFSQGAHAVHVNVTVTGVDAPGYLTVWPAGQPRPATSNVAWGAAGATSAVGTTVGVGQWSTSEWGVNIYLGGNVIGFPCRVILDITGYYRV